jgi:hypothetical protein
MKIYLAGESYGDICEAYKYDFYKLQSFYYIEKMPKKGTIFAKKIPKYNSFLLDSGAFTYMMSKGKKLPNIDEFTERYIEYINNYGIDLFFEMDVDSVFGYEKVLKLRERIESKTGKRVIPVFHKNRGFNDWISMCKDYDYISIGIAGKDCSWGARKIFLKFINSAREYGCKVHGLGITGTRSLETVPFYSVDSTSWTTGNRFGHIWKFNGREMIKIDKPIGSKIINQRKLAHYNFGEWCKFQEHMKNRMIVGA